MGDASQLSGLIPSASHALTASFTVLSDVQILQANITEIVATRITASAIKSLAKFTTDELEVIGSGTPQLSSPTVLKLTAGSAVKIENVLHLTPHTTSSVTSPANGQIVYDTGSHKFMGYANGVWVAFH